MRTDIAEARGMHRMHGTHPIPIAYRNEAFMNSDDARTLRILAEYLEPLQRFREHGIRDTIVFFGSARMRPEGPLGRYYEDAQKLARLVTEWAAAVPDCARFVVCSGGGGGVMEAANRGAAEAGGLTIGLNIGLPHEQRPNPYVTPDLCFEFRYFFMRKLWFAHLARALVVFPGGFGTLDELMEMLTLSQTRKLARPIPILLFGTDYWREIINFEGLVKHGMIDASDLSLFRFVDSPEQAITLLKELLPCEPEARAPAFAKSRSTAPEADTTTALHEAAQPGSTDRDH